MTCVVGDKMKTTSVICFFLLAVTAHGGDSVTIVRVPGMGAGTTNTVLARIDGQEFENIRKDIEKITGMLGTNTVWSSFGPDVSYLSAEINLAGKKYTIRSWHPIHKDKETIAVSEEWGLMAVSGREEKAKIEGQNTERYRTLVSVFDLCRITIPQPDRTNIVSGVVPGVMRKGKRTPQP